MFSKPHQLPILQPERPNKLPSGSLWASASVKGCWEEPTVSQIVEKLILQEKGQELGITWWRGKILKGPRAWWLTSQLHSYTVYDVPTVLSAEGALLYRTTGGTVKKHVICREHPISVVVTLVWAQQMWLNSLYWLGLRTGTQVRLLEQGAVHAARL